MTHSTWRWLVRAVALSRCRKDGTSDNELTSIASSQGLKSDADEQLILHIPYVLDCRLAPTACHMMFTCCDFS